MHPKVKAAGIAGVLAAIAVSFVLKAFPGLAPHTAAVTALVTSLASTVVAVAAAYLRKAEAVYPQVAKVADSALIRTLVAEVVAELQHQSVKPASGNDEPKDPWKRHTVAGYEETQRGD